MDVNLPAIAVLNESKKMEITGRKRFISTRHPAFSGSYFPARAVANVLTDDTRYRRSNTLSLEPPTRNRLNRDAFSVITRCFAASHSAGLVCRHSIIFFSATKKKRKVAMSLSCASIAVTPTIRFKQTCRGSRIGTKKMTARAGVWGTKGYGVEWKQSTSVSHRSFWLFFF